MTDAKKHVIVKPFDKVELRLPIEVLMSNPKYKKRRDLFLQGYAEVQSRDATDPTSFYAVAGIHGLPYAPYDLLPGEKIQSSDWNSSETDRWGGYCHHGDILFPTWHRPYISLIEVLVYEAARDLIYNDKNYPAGSETDEYKQEVEKLRFPYWDWASPSTLSSGVPSVLFDEYVFVDNPTQKNVKIRNPLRAFTLPVDLGSLTLVGDVSNPTQRPYSPDSTTTPYTPKGYATVRHPNSDYISNSDATSLNVVMYCSSIFRPVLYQVLLVDKWDQFSNHGNSEGKPEENYGHYSSIEVLHDSFHDAFGGPGGHMTYADIASFDPIFFLHHCNVDRQIAIWQACHPDVWIIGNADTEGTFTQAADKFIDENTPLAPFRKSENEYWTSKLVRNTKALGFTYPELEKNPNSRDLLRSMLKYYHPNLNLQYHWKLTLAVKKNKVGAPFQIRVFLDLPANASTPINSPNFAGLVSIFARGKETQCANCLRNFNTVVHGIVDLTACMQRLFIDTNPKPSGELTDQSLQPNNITLVAVLKDGSEISLENAGLISASYWICDEGPDFDLNYENWTKKRVGQVYPSQ
ncbi:common central domain of tyrosinase-domain-containing protein [Gigaspora rosea]|uniref:tyrosinase n=1 Tax=Gigaspora rosea TaxID=44941 RepID=A0A397W4L1_9GLOM|nr:common central domain of tyrosinase-domain-containing protein [Gigaspora rosea]